MGEQPEMATEIRHEFRKADEPRSSVGDEARDMANTETRFDRLRDPQHTVDLVDKIFWRDMLMGIFHNLQVSEAVAKRNPGTTKQRLAILRRPIREIARQTIKRQGNARDAAADEIVGR